MTWILGIQGPQGCGKSTLASALVEEWGRSGVRATAVSIDDFYLTHAEQQALASRHAGNPYLLYRGYPGTHDVALGQRTIGALASLGVAQSTDVPVYDKSAHLGRGDRAPASAWRRVAGPIDVLVVEGWMLGFTPVDAKAEALTVDPALRAPNEYLEAYRTWHDRIDAFVHMHVDSLDTVVRWRVDSGARAVSAVSPRSRTGTLVTTSSGSCPLTASGSRSCARIRPAAKSPSSISRRIAVCAQGMHSSAPAERAASGIGALFIALPRGERRAGSRANAPLARASPSRMRGLHPP